MLYSGFMVGIGLGTVFQLAFLPFMGMRSFDEWTGLLVWGFAISIGTGVISALSFWIMTVLMIRQGK
jgi:hypothetical protein